MTMTSEISQKLEALDEVLTRYENSKIAVLCRGDPDPDFVGAACALGLLAAPHKITARYLSTEPVGCAQNQEMLDWAEMKIRVYRQGMDLSGYNGFFVLDAHGIDRRIIRGLNGVPWVGLIDHHEPQLNGRVPEFFDVRRDVGSTSTILTLYLREKGMLEADNDLHRRVATCLSYGIRVDTNGLKRGKVLDYEAISFLLGYCEQNALSRLLYQRLTSSDMDTIGTAWDNRVSCNNSMISGVGRIEPSNKTALAFAADRINEIMGFDNVLVYGVVGDDVKGSFRTCDPAVRPMAFFDKMFPQIHEWGGDCGGHETGGFSIPLDRIAPDVDEDTAWSMVQTFMQTQFFQAMGHPVPMQSHAAPLRPKPAKKLQERQSHPQSQ